MIELPDDIDVRPTHSAVMQSPPTLLESAVRMAARAGTLPADADVAFFGTLTREKSIRLGVAARLGHGWRVVADLGISHNRAIDGTFVVLGKL